MLAELIDWLSSCAAAGNRIAVGSVLDVAAAAAGLSEARLIGGTTGSIAVIELVDCESAVGIELAAGACALDAAGVAGGAAVWKLGTASTAKIGGDEISGSIAG